MIINNIRKYFRMKKQKLSLHDFEAVATAELLEVKGGAPHPGQIFGYGRGETNYDGVSGGGGGGGCQDSGGAKAGDPDGFGGTYSLDEITVTGEWDAPCYACSDRDSPRPAWNPGLGTLLRDLFMHRDGCPDSL